MNEINDENEAIKYCAKCHAGNKPEAKFCKACGAEFTDFRNDNPIPKQVISIPEKSQKETDKKRIMQLGLLGILCLGIAGGAYLFGRYYGSEASVSSQSESTEPERTVGKEISGSTSYEINTENSTEENEEKSDEKITLETDQMIPAEAQEETPEENPEEASEEVQEITQELPSPFYGIWCYASKDSGEAYSYAENLPYDENPAEVFVTTDWSNLNSEKWYVVTKGTYSTEAEANAHLGTVQSYCSGAYVKYSGDYQGG